MCLIGCHSAYASNAHHDVVCIIPGSIVRLLHACLREVGSCAPSVSSPGTLNSRQAPLLVARWFDFSS
eukprot:362856-Chlamydomonas_euryale.AAC.9